MSETTIANTAPLTPMLHAHRIMVVGVNEVDEMLLRYILEELGAGMDIVNSGREALDQVQERSIDMVIMNTQLRDQNALELAKKLRQTQQKTLPIIGITAQDAQSRSLFQGFNYIIHRPIEKQKVHRALREHLSTID